jgi:hypothetical protein
VANRLAKKLDKNPNALEYLIDLINTGDKRIGNQLYQCWNKNNSG